jgi:hypothetical protein
VQEIGDFLEKLGMPEYSECFAQNKIVVRLPGRGTPGGRERMGGHGRGGELRKVRSCLKFGTDFVGLVLTNLGKKSCGGMVSVDT